ncbi:MAG: hypothetical protein ABW278_10435 [Steroidobacteraceae bacterium]
MKRFIVGAVITAIAVISYVAVPAATAERPAGVTAKEWVSISASLGIVLVAGEAPIVGRVDPDTRTTKLPPGGVPLLLKPPVGGYFMVKGAGGWTRLVVIEPTKGPADVG